MLKNQTMEAEKLTPQEQRARDISEFTAALCEEFETVCRKRVPREIWRYNDNLAKALYNAVSKICLKRYGRSMYRISNGLFSRPGKYVSRTTEASAYPDALLSVKKERKGTLRAMIVRAGNLFAGISHPDSYGVIYELFRLTKDQKKLLAQKIRTDPDLVTQLSHGYFDLRLFKLCQEAGIQLVPLGVWGFKRIYDNPPGRYFIQHRHAPGEGIEVLTATVIYMLADHLRFAESCREYFKNLGLIPKELAGAEADPWDYSRTDTFLELMTNPTEQEIPDRGLDFCALVKTEIPPRSESDVFDRCGDITVPFDRYSLSDTDALGYDAYCAARKEIFLKYFKDNFAKARRLAQSLLLRDTGPLIHITGNVPLFSFRPDGITVFHKEFRGSYIKKSASGDREYPATPLCHEHHAGALAASSFKITGIPECLFFDSLSYSDRIKDINTQIWAFAALWVIAARITAAGAFAPQPYYVEEEDSYAVRFIPDISVPAIKELCAQTGYAAMRVQKICPLYTALPEFPGELNCSPPGLGITLLSKFIQSFVSCAALGEGPCEFPADMAAYFPFTQLYFDGNERSWFHDAIFDLLKPFAGIPPEAAEAREPKTPENFKPLLSDIIKNHGRRKNAVKKAPAKPKDQTAPASENAK